MELLVRHASAVCTVASYERAARKQLAEGQVWLDFLSELYDLYRQTGIDLVLKEFRESMFSESIIG
ncbi:hypothetical protein ACWDRB_62490 [Nonomuraea sp. NPDC003707]